MHTLQCVYIKLISSYSKMSQALKSCLPKSSPINMYNYFCLECASGENSLSFDCPSVVSFSEFLYLKNSVQNNC